jgi:hypothetical protein
MYAAEKQLRHIPARIQLGFFQDAASSQGSKEKRLP